MLKKFFSSMMAAILLLAVIPIQSFANENESESIKEDSFTQLRLVDDVYESDFLNFKDMTDLSTSTDSFVVYPEKINQNSAELVVQPNNIFRLLFSVIKNGALYIVKVSSKGKTIKDVRNGKLEVDVDSHINAKNRFGEKNYGSMDKLVKYIVEDIRRADAAGLVKEGDNSIKTVYGEDLKPLEIRFHVSDGKLLQFNAFPNHSKRELGNVLWLVPQ